MNRDPLAGANGSASEPAEAGRSAEVRLLSAGELHFTATAGGFLALTMTGGERTEHYPRINAYRTFPLSAADRYLSLRDADGKEIGLLESLADLPREQAALLQQELERRYFTRSSSGCAR